jgi:tetratricopeptide (TPR) repeat protein
MLAVITAAVYLPVRHYEFINYDDDVYVTLNPHLRNGLSWEAAEWSFAAGLIYSSPNVDYWRPLSYLSHALDIKMFGSDPAGHHLMSLAIHVAATISLFWVLNLMTGARWRSAFVAALFALHPLHVESVAWIAERKDVLSGLFFILTLGAYVRYAQGRSRVESRGSSAGPSSLALDPRPSTLDYCLVLLFFTLGLMSKPIVVTLPFVLLLLDYWPLRRFAGSLAANEYYRSSLRSQFPIKTVRRLVVEKLPFFLLAMGLSVFAFHSQKAIGAATLLHVSLPARIGNALASYAAYILNLFWPVDLAVFYPYHIALPVWQVAGALALLTGITFLALVAARRCPWLPVGWFWFLGMLLPVIGILQVGAQARADRYTYLSSIGFFLMVTWTVGELCPLRRHRKLVLGAAMAIILAILTACASIQIACWRNSESLWTHALACTSDNVVARYHLGLAFFQQRRADEAITQFQMALEIQPDYAEARYNLGTVLLQQKRMDEAITQLQKALEIKPDNASPHKNLGIAFLKQGRLDEAIVHFKKSLAIRPDQVEIQNNLAWLLATSPQASLRNGIQAVELAQRANQLTGAKNPNFLCTLAAAYAEAGRFSEAVETAQRALPLARAQYNTALADDIQSQLKLYQAGVSFHLPEPTPPK